MKVGAGTAAILAGVLLAGGPVRARAGDDPFVVPREQVAARVGVVALAPLALPKGLSSHGDARTEFERLVGEHLRAAGFRTVPSDRFALARNALLDSLQGLFNPVTGERDSAKIRALNDGLRNRLRAAGADAVLYTEIVTRQANFSGKKAEWDGASEEGGHGRDVVDYLLGSSYSGSLMGLSLAVRLEDLDGRLLYRRRGGIQLASRIQDKKFVDVPERELLRDPERNAKSVRIALEPLEKK